MLQYKRMVWEYRNNGELAETMSTNARDTSSIESSASTPDIRIVLGCPFNDSSGSPFVEKICRLGGKVTSKGPK